MSEHAPGPEPGKLGEDAQAVLDAARSTASAYAGTFQALRRLFAAEVGLARDAIVQAVVYLMVATVMLGTAYLLLTALLVSALRALGAPWLLALFLPLALSVAVAWLGLSRARGAAPRGFRGHAPPARAGPARLGRGRGAVTFQDKIAAAALAERECVVARERARAALAKLKHEARRSATPTRIVVSGLALGFATGLRAPDGSASALGGPLVNLAIETLLPGLMEKLTASLQPSPSAGEEAAAAEGQAAAPPEAEPPPPEAKPRRRRRRAA